MHAVSNARKILLVTNDLGPHAGGIESFILGLLGEMNGSDVVIYTSSEEGDKEFDRKLEAQYGVVVIRDRAKTLLPTPRVNRSVSKVMRRYQSTHIWFGAAAPLGWMAGHLRRSSAQRIVALTHGHEVWWSRIWPFTLVMKSMAKQIDAFGYLGEFTKSAMKGAIKDRTQFVRIAPGISINHFTPGERSQELIKKYELEGKFVIVCVARLVPRKGQDKLIEAMPAIIQAHPNAILLIVGQGSYKSKLDSLVKKNNLGQYVRFVGRVSYDQLPAHIRLGDIFAMPSRSRLFGLEVEGLGIVYLEASACGIPVIAGASGGAPDAVLEGETGTVVDGNSADEIARAVIALADNPTLRLAMSKKGREWTEAEWSWKLWGKRFTELLLGKKR